ncbi:hypothetical protein [Thermosulfuriphilus sp.]
MFRSYLDLEKAGGGFPIIYSLRGKETPPRSTSHEVSPPVPKTGGNLIHLSSPQELKAPFGAEKIDCSRRPPEGPQVSRPQTSRAQVPDPLPLERGQKLKGRADDLPASMVESLAERLFAPLMRRWRQELERRGRRFHG